MDNKRTKFSPDSIDEIERQTIARLISNENRYEVPSTFKGRAQTNWDALVLAVLRQLHTPCHRWLLRHD